LPPLSVAAAIVRSFNHAIGHFPERREMVAKSRFRVMFRQVFHAQSTGNEDDIIGESVTRRCSFVFSFHRRLFFLSRFLRLSLSLVTAAHGLEKSNSLSLSLSFVLSLSLSLSRLRIPKTRERETRESRVLSFLSLSLSLCARVLLFLTRCLRALFFPVHFFSFRSSIIRVGHPKYFEPIFFSSSFFLFFLHKKICRESKSTHRGTFFVLANARVFAEDDFYALRERYDGTSSNILAFSFRAVCVSCISI